MDLGCARGPQPAHIGAARKRASPTTTGCHTNSDTRAPVDYGQRRVTRSGILPAGRGRITQVKVAPVKRGSILGQRNPHRFCQVAGAAPHQAEPFERLGGTQKDRGRHALGLGDHIDELVDTVVEVDVRPTRCSVERRVARRPAWGRVTRRVGFSDIRFDFNNPSDCRPLASSVDQYPADEVFGDLQRRP